VKRALPLWLVAVVPTTLAAHGLAYVLAHRSLSGPQHTWVLPTFDVSIAVLLTSCAVLLAGALLRAGILAHTSVEHSTRGLWMRLSCAQLLLFVAMERAEGTHAGVLGCVAQVAAALCVAFLLTLFSRVLAGCVIAGESAMRYIDRLATGAPSFVARRPRAAAYALFASAGSSRFQRPPPYNG